MSEGADALLSRFSDSRRLPTVLLAIGCWAAMLLALYGNVFVSDLPLVISAPGQDMYLQDWHWRAFATRELLHGNLPLWNPHIYSGTPFLAAGQSGLFYPPHVLFLVLPLRHAINLSILLHLLIAACTMYGWCAFYRIHGLACLAAGTMFMLSGPFYLHVYAGHLGRICAMPWTPLILMAVEGLLLTKNWSWILLAAGAGALQLLAGDPQYAWCTGIAAFIWIIVRLVRSEANWKAVLVVLLAALGAASLAAVELFPTVASSGETLRGQSLPYGVASSFSFPPQNLITFLAPGFFGGVAGEPYRGRWFLWEMCAYFTVTGLLLALLGMWTGRRRVVSPAAVVAFIMAVLALGSYTPLYHTLYQWVPLVDRFRGMSKFMFVCVTPMLVVSAEGMSGMLRGNALPRAFIRALYAAAGFLVVAAVADAALPARLNVVHASASTRIPSLAIAAAVLIAATLLLRAARKQPIYRLTLVSLCVVEALTFAALFRSTFRADRIGSPVMEKTMSDNEDVRTLFTPLPDLGMSAGWNDVWGYGPTVLTRYSRFIAAAEGMGAELALPYAGRSRMHPVYRMLRCHTVVLNSLAGSRVTTIADPLPHVLLVPQWRKVASDSETSLIANLLDPAFNPQRLVLIDQEQAVGNSSSSASNLASARIVSQSTDELRIEAETSTPQILLITDAYSKGWSARPLPGSSQSHYDVIPADYILRGVPLAAGHHELLLSYSPPGFRLGRIVSVLALCVLLIASLVLIASRCLRKAGHSSSTTSWLPASM